MKQVFGYIRVSTAKQGEGVSLTVQKESIIRYAQSHELNIIEWFEEKETAAKQGRPLFTTMLKKLRTGKAIGVIIHKIDRSARNLKDWAALGELIDKGVEVHFAHESLDLRARGGRLSADIQAVIASDYIRNLREESIKGIYGRLEQGIYPFQAPIGYTNMGAGKPKAIDPVKGPLVREAFELYATKQYSLDDLGEILYKRGLRNLRGCKVSQNGLSSILNNSFYMGVIKIKGKVFKGAHDQLISPNVFDTVQNILKGKVNNKTNTHSFHFRKLITCESCQYSLIGEKQKGNVYYRCHTKECGTKGYRENYIDSLFKNLITAIKLYPEELAILTELVSEIDKDWFSTQKKILPNLSLQIEQANERMEMLTDALLDKIIDKETFSVRKERLLREIQNIKHQENELMDGQGKILERIRKFLELVKSLENNYDLFTADEKRDLVETITSNLTIKGKTVEFTMISPFMELANRFNFQFGAPDRSTPRTTYTKFVYGGNTSAILGKPLSREQLKKLLDSMILQFTDEVMI